MKQGCRCNVRLKAEPHPGQEIPSAVSQLSSRFLSHLFTRMAGCQGPAHAAGAPASFRTSWGPDTDFPTGSQGHFLLPHSDQFQMLSLPLHPGVPQSSQTVLLGPDILSLPPSKTPFCWTHFAFQLLCYFFAPVSGLSLSHSLKPSAKAWALSLPLILKLLNLIQCLASPYGPVSGNSASQSLLLTLSSSAPRHPVPVLLPLSPFLSSLHTRSCLRAIKTLHIVLPNLRSPGETAI